MQLNDIVKLHIGWRDPDAYTTTPLNSPNGRSEVFLVQRENSGFVVCIHGPDKHQHPGLGTISDVYRTHDHATRMKVAPRLVTHQKKFTVTEYFDGKPLVAGKIIDPNVVFQVGEATGLIHNGPTLKQEPNPFSTAHQMINACEGQLTHMGGAGIYEKGLKLEAWLKANAPGVCSHMDTTPYNWLKANNGKVKVVDFEMACNSTPAIDFGMFFFFGAVPYELEETYVAGYRRPRPHISKEDATLTVRCGALMMNYENIAGQLEAYQFPNVGRLVNSFNQRLARYGGLPEILK